MRTELKNKKTILSVLTISALVLLLSSCKNPENVEGLEISIPNKTTVIPVNMMSCTDTDPKSPSLTAGAFEFTDFKYKWGGKGTLNIAYIQVELQSSFISGGKADCILGAEDLENTLGSAPRTIAEGNATQFTSGCTLRCGGIKFNNEHAAAFGTGKVTIVGTVKYDDGENDSVDASQDFSFEYKGKP